MAFVVAIAVLGLLAGSLGTVATARLPREEPLRGAPHCSTCAARIAGRDLVPVVSWLLLRGRCRSCDAPIGREPLVVELLTGATFAVLASVLGPQWTLPAFLYVAASGIALSTIDLRTRRLPNQLTLPSILVVAGLLLLPAIAEGAWSDYGRALLGGLALFAFYLLLALIYPAGMGMGDVKLAPSLGLALGFLGWGPWAVGAFLTFVLGGLVGIVVLLRVGRGTTIPFGPYMVAGTLLAILWGQQLADWYVGGLG